MGNWLPLTLCIDLMLSRTYFGMRNILSLLKSLFRSRAFTFLRVELRDTYFYEPT